MLSLNQYLLFLIRLLIKIFFTSSRIHAHFQKHILSNMLGYHTYNTASQGKYLSQMQKLSL